MTLDGRFHFVAIERKVFFILALRRGVICSLNANVALTARSVIYVN